MNHHSNKTNENESNNCNCNIRDNSYISNNNEDNSTTADSVGDVTFRGMHLHTR
jgi:hypothetical protein